MAVEVKQQEAEKSSTQWANELLNPEVQEALSTLIQKLPQIKEAVVKAEQGIEAVSTFVTNTESLGSLAGGVDRLSKVALNQENLDSLLAIMDKLPRIAQSLEVLDRVAPVVEKLANRDNLIAITEVFGIVTEPAKEKIQDGVSIVKEAKERAERDQTNISIFGVLGMLKDPAVQKGLRFVRAFLDILNEKK